MQHTYLITGGTSGIGLATAKLLQQQGHRVIVTGRQPEGLALASQQLGEDARVLACDHSQFADNHKLAIQLAAQKIKLDGLFLNAGVFIPGLFTDTTEQQIDHTFNINFKGPFFTLQALLPLLNNPASVVLNSSLATQKAFAGGAVYTASKAALESLARVLNVELATRGIRVNTVQPGVTLTPIQARAGMSEEAIAQLTEDLKQSPMGRVLYAGDIAPVAAFLLSPGSLGMYNAQLATNGGTAL